MSLEDYLVLNPELPWICETCRSCFAEYINGCPHCWNAGEIRSRVSYREKLLKDTQLKQD